MTNLLYSRIAASRASKFLLELIIVIALTCIIAEIANDWEEAEYKKEYQNALARGYGADDIGESGTYYFVGIFFCFIYYIVWFLRIIYVTKINSTETLKYEFLDILLFVASLPIILIILLIIISIIA